MKLKNNILLVCFLLLVNTVSAQYLGDALRFSQSEQGTTARFRGLGNAQTALGGDISSLASNPAGLGLFTRSEINFTADYSSNDSKATYLNTGSNELKQKLNLNQIGGVWATKVRRPKGADLSKGLVGLNFGVAYNKTNNFNATTNYGGVNPNSSYADYTSDLATNNYLGAGDPSGNTDILPAGSLERMAYDNFLMEYNSSGYFPTTSLNNNQQDITYHTGSQSEVNFGIGANYSNKLYFGGSLGIASLNYNSDREFMEFGDNRTYVGQPADFIGGTYDLSYRSSQRTTGTGINGKLGFIYRATPNIRLGVNYVTPTLYTVSDDYSEVLDTRYTTSTGSPIPEYTNNASIYQSDYNLRTPGKLNGGVAFLFNNQGLISADVEYVDYTSIHFSSDDAIATRNTNNAIRSNYQEAVNFRVGGEYKVNSVMLRAGYNMSGNPYKNADYSNQSISAGIGYRINYFYIDLTYVNTAREYSIKPYTISQNYPDFSSTGSGDAASIKQNTNSAFVTIGTRF